MTNFDRSIEIARVIGEAAILLDEKGISIIAFARDGDKICKHGIKDTKALEEALNVEIGDISTTHLLRALPEAFTNYQIVIYNIDIYQKRFYFFY